MLSCVGGTGWTEDDNRDNRYPFLSGQSTLGAIRHDITCFCLQDAGRRSLSSDWLSVAVPRMIGRDSFTRASPALRPIKGEESPIDGSMAGERQSLYFNAVQRKNETTAPAVLCGPINEHRLYISAGEPILLGGQKERIVFLSSTFSCPRHLLCLPSQGVILQDHKASFFSAAKRRLRITSSHIPTQLMLLLSFSLRASSSFPSSGRCFTLFLRHCD